MRLSLDPASFNLSPASLAGHRYAQRPYCCGIRARSRSGELQPMKAWSMDVPFLQDSVGRDPTEQPEICHHAVPLVRAHGILEPGREDSTAACLGSPENALRQPELPQLESAEVLGHFLQHAQHAQQLSPAPAQILSPSPNFAHAKQASLHQAQLQVQHRASPVPVQHQQTQALSPGAVMQLSPTAMQVWQPLSPGHGPNGSPLQLMQVAACPRPINRPCGPPGPMSPRDLRMSHAKSMHEIQACRAAWGRRLPACA